mmetsp:Transcript_110733/g.319912  ORF Transcript_110733/g.319912 Transcript_110733/m.319912 type:complete len:204 (+) Transcript_110733:884-1495(+)
MVSITASDCLMSWHCGSQNEAKLLPTSLTMLKASSKLWRPLKATAASPAPGLRRLANSMVFTDPRINIEISFQCGMCSLSKRSSESRYCAPSTSSALIQYTMYSLSSIWRSSELTDCRVSQPLLRYNASSSPRSVSNTTCSKAAMMATASSKANPCCSLLTLSSCFATIGTCSDKISAPPACDMFTCRIGSKPLTMTANRCMK